MANINYFEDYTFLRDIKRCFVIREMQARNIEEITFKYDIENNTFYMNITQNAQYMEYEYKVKKYMKYTRKRRHSPETYESNKKIELQDTSEKQDEDDKEINKFLPYGIVYKGYHGQYKRSKGPCEVDDCPNEKRNVYGKYCKNCYKHYNIKDSYKTQETQLQDTQLASSINNEVLENQGEIHVLKKQIECLLNVNSENDVLAETLEKMDNESETILLDYTDDFYCRELYNNLKSYQKRRYANHRKSIDKLKIILENIMKLFQKYGFASID